MFFRSFLLTSLFAFNAFAADAAAGPSSTFASFMPLVLIFVIFYFLLIRPQQKKMKEHQIMVTELKSGSKVCTSSGIYGVIKKVNQDDNTFELEIAEGVIIKISKNSVSEIIKKEAKNSNIINQIKKSKKTTKK